MDHNVNRLRAMFNNPTAFKVKVNANDRRIFPWNDPTPSSPVFWEVSVSPLNVLACLKDKPDIKLTRINQVHDEMTEIIAKQLLKPVICSDLTIEKLEITEKGFSSLMSSIGMSQNLLKVMIWQCNFGENCGKYLEHAFSLNTRIKLLDLTDCNIGNNGAIGLGNALKMNSTLRKLNLSRNQIEDDGAIAIGEGLRENTTLFTLILSDNSIEEKGACSIAEALHDNSSLGFLRMKKNLIRNEGAIAFSEMIKHNKGLLELNLGECCIMEEGLRALWQSLEFNSTLFKIEILHGNVPSREINMEEMKQKVAQRIEHNQNQQKRLFHNALMRNESASWGRTRLLFIGQGRAGKTATVRALLREPFVENHESTIGANLTQLSTRADRDCGWAKQQDDYTSRHAAKILAEKHFELLLKGKEQDVSEESTSVKRKEKVAFTKNNRKVVSVRKLPNREASLDFSLLPTDAKLIKRRYSLPGGQELNKEKKEKRSLPKNVGDIAGEFNIDEFMKRPFEQTMAFRSRQDKEALNFTLWDFGGQEVFYTMHHLFLSSHGLYFLVFNCLEVLEASKNTTFDETDDNHPKRYLNFWLNSVAVHAPKASVLLVGTHIDALQAETKDLNDINEFLVSVIAKKEQIVNIVENQEDGFCFFPVSNKNLTGIHHLQVIIEKEARNQGHVDHKVPIRWMACLDKLIDVSKGKLQGDGRKKKKFEIAKTAPKAHQRLKRKNHNFSYISMKEVKNFAKRFEIHSHREVEDMLKLFNELGVLIYLSNNPILKQKVILKPQWLIDVLGKVIRDSSIHVDEAVFKDAHLEADYKLAYEKGIFSTDLIEFLWRDQDIEFLTELMETTMLMSEWDFSSDGEKHYLVPSLLKRQQEPKGSFASKAFSRLRSLVTSFSEPESFGFSCFFDFSAKYLPIGVFERIICVLVSYDAIAYLINSEERIMIEKYTEPMLAKNICLVSLNEQDSVKLELKQDEQELTISLNVIGTKEKRNEMSVVAARAFKLIRDALVKVNNEVMSNGLEWDVVFMNSGQRLSESEAKQNKLGPWFDQKDPIEPFLETGEDLFEEL